MATLTPTTAGCRFGFLVLVAFLLLMFAPASSKSSQRRTPQRGVCGDGVDYDCNLIEVLEDGLVLIEDLRNDGVFVEMPKSTYRKKRRRSNNTPAATKANANFVIIPEDPLTDIRTNIELNMMGI